MADTDPDPAIDPTVADGVGAPVTPDLPVPFAIVAQAAGAGTATPDAVPAAARASTISAAGPRLASQARAPGPRAVAAAAARTVAPGANGEANSSAVVARGAGLQDDAEAAPADEPDPSAEVEAPAGGVIAASSGPGWDAPPGPAHAASANAAVPGSTAPANHAAAGASALAASAAAEVGGSAAPAAANGVSPAASHAGSSVDGVPVGNVPVEIGLKSLAGMNRFEIRLSPDDLGRIDVRLDIQDGNRVQAHLTVDRPETLAFLQRDSGQLERALEQAGLRPQEGGGVSLSLRDPGQGSGQDPGGTGRQMQDGQPRQQGQQARPDRASGPQDGDRGRPIIPRGSVWTRASGVDLRI